MRIKLGFQLIKNSFNTKINFCCDSHDSGHIFAADNEIKKLNDSNDIIVFPSLPKLCHIGSSIVKSSMFLTEGNSQY